MRARPRVRTLEVDIGYARSETTTRFATVAIVSAASCFYAGSGYAIFFGGAAPDDVHAVLAGELIALAMFAFLSAALFLFHAPIIRRFQQLEKPDDAEKMAVVESVGSIADQMGVRRPAILFSKYWRRHDAQIFGCFSKLTLRLDKGLILLRERRPDWFEAIVRHELSHALNGDIAKAYAARAAIHAAALICVPIGIIHLWQMLAELAGSLSFQANSLASAGWLGTNFFIAAQNLLLFVPLVIVLMVEFSAIVRAREHFADWRAAALGSRRALVEIFSSRRDIASPFYRSVFSHHPAWSRRVKFIKRPFPLSMRFQLSDAIIIGFVIALIFELLSNISAELIGFFGQPNVSLLSEAIEHVYAHPMILLVTLPFLFGIACAAIGVAYVAKQAAIGSWLLRKSIATDMWSGIRWSIFGTIGYLLGMVFSPLQNLRPNLDEVIAQFWLFFAFSLLTWMVTPVWVRAALIFWRDSRATRLGFFILLTVQSYWILNLAMIVAMLGAASFVGMPNELADYSGIEIAMAIVSSFVVQALCAAAIIFIFSKFRLGFQVRHRIPAWLVLNRRTDFP